MSEQHTPGPWVQQSLLVTDKRGGHICHCTRWEGVTPHPEIAEANARLIAAAPDLLAAAVDAYVALPMTKHNEPINAALRAAIDKAEGR